jgi:trans-aconitate methyltransferase
LSLLFFIGVPLCLSISIVVWTIKNGIGPTITSPKQKRCLLASLPEDLKGNVFDLGSGWGTLAISLARQLPACQVIGYESSPVPYLFSRVLQFLLRFPNLKFNRQDILRVSLQEASLIVCYLYPAAMKKLKPKFEEELHPGTVVITNTFAVPGWNPANVLLAADIYRSKIYLYQR